MKNLFLFLFCFQFLLSFSQNYDAQLLNRKTDITISNGKLTKTEYIEIKINNRNGEGFTNISIPFSKLYKMSILDAYIKDVKGNIIRKLKSNEVTERSNISEFSLYEDDYVKEFTLKHNEYPYTICYSFQVQQNEFITIENWIPTLDSEIPTDNAELSLTIPKNYSIRFRNHLIDNPKVVNTENTITYNWKASYNQKFKREKFAPKLRDILPSVIIVPDEFKYAVKGNFHNWDEYTKWAFQLIKNINKLTDDEKSKIKAQISDIDNDYEKIKTLYHYLQNNTRYVNVSIDKGGVIPYPASYVCENKYGDCKALTNYFKSILDFVGIKSYYTFVYADEVISKISNEFPYDKFNHVILYIPLKNDTIWLDCTSKGPFNYLGTFTQNRDALVIDDVNGGLVHTPKLNPTDVLDTRNISVHYGYQSANIFFKNILRGNMFEEMSALENSFNVKDKDEILRSYFSDEKLEISDHQTIKNDRDDKYIRFEYHAKSNEIYKKYGNEIVVNNITLSIPNIEKPSERKLPILINYPINQQDSIEYDIPIGYKSGNAYKDISITVPPFGTYSMKFIEKENTVQVIKSMLINSGEYPISEYEKFYDFLNKILNYEKAIHIVFNPKN